MIKSLRRNLIILKFNRTWVDEDSREILTTSLRTLNVIVQLLMLFTVFKKMVIDKGDLASVSFCIMTIGLNGPCLGKLVDLIRYADSYKNILQQLESGLFVRFKINKNEMQHIGGAEKFIATKLTWFILLNHFSLWVWTFVPLWRKVFGLYPAGSPLDLPFYAWSPFDENNYVGYIALYIFHAYYGASMWAIWIGLDTFSTGIVYHICAHLKIIGERIKNWKSVEKLKPGEILTLVEERRDLRGIISYHVEVLSLGKNFNEACSHGFLHKLFFISLVMCCCGIQILSSSRNEATHVFVIGVLMTCMVLSWLMICFIGTKMISESRKLGEKLYFIDWTVLTKKERKDLCYILHRTQVPINMTAGKFYTISLSLFVDMVKMSYSLLAVLRNVFD